MTFINVPECLDMILSKIPRKLLYSSNLMEKHWLILSYLLWNFPYTSRCCFYYILRLRYNDEEYIDDIAIAERVNWYNSFEGQLGVYQNLKYVFLLNQ